MDYKVVMSPSARADIREIVRYISWDAPDRALEFGRFLISKTKWLGQFPEAGRVVREFNVPTIREIVVRSYRVIYRIDHERKKVAIARFWHSARREPRL